MKRRTISFFLALITLLMVPINVSAAENTINADKTIWFEDGSSMEFIILENTSRASGTKTGTKQATYRDSTGEVCWIATLTGTFTYTGTSSTCTSSTCNVTIYDNAWYVVSKSSSRSGNTATATVTMGLKVLGVTVSKPTYNLTLTCDKDGNLS